MKCTYEGNFDSPHHNDKRRRMTGEKLRDATKKLVHENMAPSEFLKQEARKYISFGNKHFFLHTHFNIFSEDTYIVPLE